MDLNTIREDLRGSLIWLADKWEVMISNALVYIAVEVLLPERTDIQLHAKAMCVSMTNSIAIVCLTAIVLKVLTITRKKK